MPKGMLIVVSAPSGAGKSTVCQKLLQRHKQLRYSISCTTRAPRSGEKNNKHYFFLTEEEFKRRIRRNEFLEWAVVHGHYYGTPRHFINSCIQAGQGVLLALDIQGACAIRRKMPETVLIFLAPPSWAALKERLSLRRDDAASVAVRLANAKAEMEASSKYDYYVVNDDLEKALAQIDSIVMAESLKTFRQELAPLPLVSAKESRRNV